MVEIGSEFSLSLLLEKQGMRLPSNTVDYTYTFSGRTAIETVLENEPHIKKVMMPSYCCDSMMEPFRRKGIVICFYDVFYEDGLQVNLHIDKDADAVLWCNYFGFHQEIPDMSEFISRGGIVIEDITHSFLSEKQYHPQSHYLVASVRKWEPVFCGGYCGSMKKPLKIKPEKIPPMEFLNLKKSAMTAKRDYLAGDAAIRKEDFLKDFADSNHWLGENYSGLAIDEESEKILNSVDSQKQRQIRRNNAKTLYDGLKNCSNIKLLFEEPKMDCPLFVPVILETEKRNRLRKKLIENQIYCPVHWPKSDMGCESNLYSMELSLICDQRYGEADMNRMVNIIKNFENK